MFLKNFVPKSHPDYATAQTMLEACGHHLFDFNGHLKDTAPVSVEVVHNPVSLAVILTYKWMLPDLTPELIALIDQLQAPGGLQLTQDMTDLGIQYEVQNPVHWNVQNAGPTGMKRSKDLKQVTVTVVIRPVFGANPGMPPYDLRTGAPQHPGFGIPAHPLGIPQPGFGMPTSPMGVQAPMFDLRQSPMPRFGLPTPAFMAAMQTAPVEPETTQGPEQWVDIPLQVHQSVAREIWFRERVDLNKDQTLKGEHGELKYSRDSGAMVLRLNIGLIDQVRYSSEEEAPRGTILKFQNYGKLSDKASMRLSQAIAACVDPSDYNFNQMVLVNTGEFIWVA